MSRSGSPRDRSCTRRATVYFRDSTRNAITLFEQPWDEDHPPTRARIFAAWDRGKRQPYPAMQLPQPQAAWMNGRLSRDAVRHIQGQEDQAAVAIYNMRLLETEAAARREAEQANAMKLRFLGMVSHELRTPLTSIKGFATTLLAPDVTWGEEEVHDFLATIDRESDKLTDLVDQLLDLSRIEAGTLRVEPGPNVLAGIFAAALPRVASATSEHSLVTFLPPDLPLVRADGQRIEQVLINLMSNAAKYSPPGTRIEVTAQRDGGFVQVSVHDEGPGIPPEERPRIFEPFRRGSNGAIRKKKGAGLGLAICKDIVEAHGGRIWVEDDGPPGTTLCFTLPVFA